jgi:hypothetical protein
MAVKYKKKIKKPDCFSPVNGYPLRAESGRRMKDYASTENGPVSVFLIYLILLRFLLL